jgi:queuine/archaeosine tRNA-ribosyltransferase
LIQKEKIDPKKIIQKNQNLGADILIIIIKIQTIQKDSEKYSEKERKARPWESTYSHYHQDPNFCKP